MNEDIARMIETIFKTQWDLKTNAPAVKFRNVAFTQPANGEWVTLTIVPATAFQASLGDQKIERQLGSVIFQIFTPLNTGDRRAKAISDLIASIFRYITFVMMSDNTITTVLNGRVITLVQAGFLETEDGDILTTEDGEGLLIEGAETTPKMITLFRSPIPHDVGERDTYYQLNMSIPFQADRLFP